MPVRKVEQFALVEPDEAIGSGNHLRLRVPGILLRLGCALGIHDIRGETVIGLGEALRERDPGAIGRERHLEDRGSVLHHEQPLPDRGVGVGGELVALLGRHRQVGKGAKRDVLAENHATAGAQGIAVDIEQPQPHREQRLGIAVVACLRCRHRQLASVGRKLDRSDVLLAPGGLGRQLPRLGIGAGGMDRDAAGHGEHAPPVGGPVGVLERAVDVGIHPVTAGQAPDARERAACAERDHVAEAGETGAAIGARAMLVDDPHRREFELRIGQVVRGRVPAAEHRKVFVAEPAHGLIGALRLVGWQTVAVDQIEDLGGGAAVVVRFLQGDELASVGADVGIDHVVARLPEQRDLDRRIGPRDQRDAIGAAFEIDAGGVAEFLMFVRMIGQVEPPGIVIAHQAPLAVGRERKQALVHVFGAVAARGRGTGDIGDDCARRRIQREGAPQVRAAGCLGAGCGEPRIGGLARFVFAKANEVPDLDRLAARRQREVFQRQVTGVVRCIGDRHLRGIDDHAARGVPDHDVSRIVDRGDVVRAIDPRRRGDFLLMRELDDDPWFDRACRLVERRRKLGRGGTRSSRERCGCGNDGAHYRQRALPPQRRDPAAR